MNTPAKDDWRYSTRLFDWTDKRYRFDSIIRDWVNTVDKFWLRRVFLIQRWTRSSPADLPL
jgi:hypothetical protein